MRIAQRKTISSILLFIVSAMLMVIFSSCSDLYEDDPSISEIIVPDVSVNDTASPEVSSSIDASIDTELPDDSSEEPQTSSDTKTTDIETTILPEPTQSESNVTISDELTSEIFIETENEKNHNPYVSPETLSKEKTNEVIIAAINSKKFGSNNIDDYSIRCYGIFGDACAVFIDSKAVDYPAIDFEEEIDGLIFKYGSTQTLMIFSNGNLYRLNEAYTNSIIDLSSLKMLYETYSSAKWFYYVSE